MKLRTVRKIELAMWGVIIVLIILCLLVKGTVAQISAYLALAVMIALIIIAFLFQKCPYCGSFLRTYGKCCPQCGEKLDW